MKDIQIKFPETIGRGSYTLYWKIATEYTITNDNIGLLWIYYSGEPGMSKDMVNATQEAWTTISSCDIVIPIAQSLPLPSLDPAWSQVLLNQLSDLKASVQSASGEALEELNFFPDVVLDSSEIIKSLYDLGVDTNVIKGATVNHFFDKTMLP